MIKGQIDIPEFSFGELDDLQVYDNHVQFYKKLNVENMIDNRDLTFLFNNSLFMCLVDLIMRVCVDGLHLTNI